MLFNNNIRALFHVKQFMNWWTLNTCTSKQRSQHREYTLHWKSFTQRKPSPTTPWKIFFKWSFIWNSPPPLQEHYMADSEDHIPCILVAIVIYVWLWMVFRRFVEAFARIQSKTSLWGWTILYVTALASPIISQSNLRHITSQRKKGEKGEENSQQPLSSTTPSERLYGIPY